MRLPCWSVRRSARRAALGVSLYWLIYTIQSKWLYGLAHPQQVVTFEKAKSLPALFGIAFAYLSQTIPVDSVYFATVQSGFKNEVNGSVIGAAAVQTDLATVDVALTCWWHGRATAVARSLAVVCSLLYCCP